MWIFYIDRMQVVIRESNNFVKTVKLTFSNLTLFWSFQEIISFKCRKWEFFIEVFSFEKYNWNYITSCIFRFISMNVYWKRALKAICVDYIFFVENKQLFEMTSSMLHLWLLTLISVIYQNSSKTPPADGYFFLQIQHKTETCWRFV